MVPKREGVEVSCPHGSKVAGCYSCYPLLRHEEAKREAELSRRYRRDMRVVKVVQVVAMLAVFGALVYYR